MPKKDETRATLEAAHESGAQACGRLALILASNRGLTGSVIRDLALQFSVAAANLLTLVKGSS